MNVTHIHERHTYIHEYPTHICHLSVKRDIRKLKAQSSNVSFATFQWKETFELWAFSFETAFENVTPSGIGSADRKYFKTHRFFKSHFSSPKRASSNAVNAVREAQPIPLGVLYIHVQPTHERRLYMSRAASCLSNKTWLIHMSCETWLLPVWRVWVLQWIVQHIATPTHWETKRVVYWKFPSCGRCNMHVSDYMNIYNPYYIFMNSRRSCVCVTFMCVGYSCIADIHVHTSWIHVHIHVHSSWIHVHECHEYRLYMNIRHTFMYMNSWCMYMNIGYTWISDTHERHTHTNNHVHECHVCQICLEYRLYMSIWHTWHSCTWMSCSCV